MSGKTTASSVAGYDRYFMLFDLCCALFAGWLVLEAVGIEGGWVTLLEAGWLLTLLALFSRKRRDEFAEHCWRTATAATFVMLLVAPFVWAFAEGLIQGFTTEAARDAANVAAAAGAEASAGADRPYQPSFEGIVAILFATFFGSFQWTRFRGTA